MVTGGGNGIGRAMALALAERGANVLVADIELAAAQEVATEVKSIGVEAKAMEVDVRLPDEVERLADQAWKTLGSVEILCNNAGVMSGLGSVIESDARDFEWVFGVNLGGVLNGMRAFAPRFITSDKDAWIVNTGSEHSFGVPHLGAGLYTASKHAVLGVSDIARRELAGKVGVSVLCPGIVESELWRSGERRPESLGGAVPAPKENAVSMRFGLPAKDVAERVMQAIENESFYVLTHPHVVDIARERWEEVRDAFAAQAPRYEGDDAYAVPNIMKRLATGS